MTKTKRPKIISLYSGALGLDLGLESAGFDIAVAVECNPIAAETIRLNRPDIPLIERPIEDVTTAEILRAAGLKAGQPCIVSAGPSCQVFSTAGQRGSFQDPRGTMFHHFLRVVREAKPQYFVMENVRGLLSAAIRHRPLNKRGSGHPELQPEELLGSAFRHVVTELQALNYFTRFDLLNAADFGVPQRRERLVFIGSREGRLVELPTPTHAERPVKGRKKWRTLKQGLSKLRDPNPEYYRFCPSKERYLKLVPEGGNWRDLPEKMKADALGRAYVSWGGRSGFFRRLGWDKPSPALTTRPDSKATTLCHPDELRPLSVAEYACIQQFPASWTFAGSVRQKYQQVGNAVPIGLGQVLGETIRLAMRRKPNADRLGIVECTNPKLIASLAKRPACIVNPPRMREHPELEKLKEWYEDKPRRRLHVVEYAAPAVRDEVLDLLNLKETACADHVVTTKAKKPARTSKKPDRKAA